MLNTNLNGDVLWTNPNPRAGFSAQDITLDDITYRYYEVVAEFKTSYDFFVSCRLERGHGIQMIFTGTDGGCVCNLVRELKYISESIYRFGTAELLTTTGHKVNDSTVIPVHIIGFR